MPWFCDTNAPGPMHRSLCHLHPTHHISFRSSKEARDSLVPDMSSTMKEKGAIEGFTYQGGDAPIDGEGQKDDPDLDAIAE